SNSPMGGPGAEDIIPAPGQRCTQHSIILKMKAGSKTSPFTVSFSAHKCAKLFGRFKLTRNNQTLLMPRFCQRSQLAGPAEPLSIYAVDDHPRLTELYAGLLEPFGYMVRTFNLRADALAALKSDKKRPALLITDYRGLSIIRRAGLFL